MELTGRTSPVALISEQEFLQGCSLLRICCQGDVAAVSSALASNKSLAQFSDYDFRTALHVASSEGQKKVVQVLLEAGASPNRSDRWGGSPLDDALRQRHLEGADVLRKAGGRKGMADHSTELITTAARGDALTVASLMKDGISPNQSDYDLRTPLHLASAEGHEQVVSALIEAGATVDSKDRWGCTPLDAALRWNHEGVERLLRAAGATGRRGSVAAAHAPAAVAEVGGSAGKDPNEVEWADITVLEKIGSGAFGDIYKCRWRGTLVAAKTIKSEHSLRKGSAFGDDGNHPEAHTRQRPPLPVPPVPPGHSPSARVLQATSTRCARRPSTTSSRRSASWRSCATRTSRCSSATRWRRRARSCSRS